MVAHNNDNRVDIDQDPYLYGTLFDSLLPHMRPGGNLVFEHDEIHPVLRTEKPSAYPTAASVPLQTCPVNRAASHGRVSEVADQSEGNTRRAPAGRGRVAVH
eukprot:GHVU01156469.1.p4 GENE.GHVU01156469.1~~GHVU01156469.1.p4  ORF type:complete len:102 (+),score=2.17 GHVU01156469.1:296-601(+)